MFELELPTFRRSLFNGETPPIHETECVAKSNATPKFSTPSVLGQQSNAIRTPKITTEHLSLPHINHAFSYLNNRSMLDERFTVNSILKEINMEKYELLFEREEIDLLVFCLLTRDELIQLGVGESDCLILMDAIENYKDTFNVSENPRTYF